MKLTANAETDGRYHSKWLSMMYPRLFLARNLLRDDGVIFVSIDDHEFHYLRAIMAEIFGEENFVASIIWQKRITLRTVASFRLCTTTLSALRGTPLSFPRRATCYLLQRRLDSDTKIPTTTRGGIGSQCRRSPKPVTRRHLSSTNLKRRTGVACSRRMGERGYTRNRRWRLRLPTGVSGSGLKGPACPG